MYHFAVSRAKLSHKKFWRLSWYEIGLYIDRYIYDQQRLQVLEEAKWARFRIAWADFRNVHRAKNDPEVKATDLIKLSFDKPQVKKESKPDLKKAKQLLGSKFILN